MASEINKHGGIAICAAIAADDPVRKEIRNLIDNFILVYLSGSRNHKGFLSSPEIPYDPPTDADISIGTINSTPVECVDVILDDLKVRGLI